MRIKRTAPVKVLIKKEVSARMLQTLPAVMVARVKPGTVFKEIRPWA